ncbi:MAG: hypothetical protein OCD01_08425 [Fibrobacterales bacterium]
MNQSIINTRFLSKLSISRHSILTILLFVTTTAYSQPRVGPDGFFHPEVGGSSLLTVLGHKGQVDPVLIDEIGRALVKATGENIGHFGLIDNNTTPINWSALDGYYPGCVYQFDIPDFSVTLTYLATPRTISSIGQHNGDFILLFVKASLTYTGSATTGSTSIPLGAPPELTPINDAAKSDQSYDITSGIPLEFEYATAISRISGTGGPTLNSQEIQEIAGTFADAQADFKTFWDVELNRVVEVTVPESTENAEHFNNVLKSSLAHIQIVRDGDFLHVGENGYNYLFDHDAHGIFASAIEMGALTQDEAETLLRTFPIQQSSHDYIDALGKLPWAIAKFVLKFQPNQSLIQDFVFTHQFKGAGDKLKTLSDWMHTMVTDKLEDDGLAVFAETLDSHNRATVDNMAILLGLRAYRYLCLYLGETDEATWALDQYTTTHTVLQDVLLELMNGKTEEEKYVSVGIMDRTEDLPFGGQPDAFINANAYSHFFFGRMYELFLFGGDYDRLAPYIDNTLDQGIAMINGDERFLENGVWNGNFGMYNDEFCSSGYNTAYTEGLLLGNGKYRSAFYTAFDYSMDRQSGPYVWFEGVGCGEEFGVTIQGQNTAAKAGTGSAPHMWSVASQSRMLVLTFISERYDGSLVIGRGIPKDWIGKGDVGIQNYPLSNKTRFGYTISKKSEGLYSISFNGTPAGKTIVNLPQFIDEEPALIHYQNSPVDYLTQVTLTDFDADGKNEIVIDSGYTYSQPILFAFHSQVNVDSLNTVGIMVSSSSSVVAHEESSSVVSSDESMSASESMSSTILSSSMPTSESSSSSVITAPLITSLKSRVHVNYAVLAPFQDIPEVSASTEIVFYTLTGEQISRVSESRSEVIVMVMRELK